MQPEAREQPGPDQGTEYAHDEVADETKASAADDFAREEAGENANDQNHKQALVRQVRWRAPL